MLVHRSDIVMAAMAPAAQGVWFDPVRVQKLLFLMDMEISALVDGPHFNFRPHSYGPFDVAVYLELEKLSNASCVHIDQTWRHRRYQLTGAGHARGTTVLRNLPSKASRFVERACEWVLTVSFSKLLSEIYQRYPEMAINTVAPQLVPNSSSRHKKSAISALLQGLARSVDYMGTLDDHPMETDNNIRDSEALGRDWRRTGDDIRMAMEQCAT